MQTGNYVGIKIGVIFVRGSDKTKTRTWLIDHPPKPCKLHRKPRSATEGPKRKLRAALDSRAAVKKSFDQKRIKRNHRLALALTTKV